MLICVNMMAVVGTYLGTVTCQRVNQYCDFITGYYVNGYWDILVDRLLYGFISHLDTLLTIGYFGSCHDP